MSLSGQIVGYYDGSGSDRCGKPARITLAGYAAKPQVWREVETAWRRALTDDSNKTQSQLPPHVAGERVESPVQSPQRLDD